MKRPAHLLHLMTAGLLLMAAVVLRQLVAPQLLQLPATYYSELLFDTVSYYRSAPEDAWARYPLLARRVDQVLTTAGNVAIVQGNLYWTTASGATIFETTGIYGVDRLARRNVTGYGDIPRSGQYLFPTHVQPTTYTYWDQAYSGQRTATYSGTTTLEGLPVFVFDFRGVGMDETAGYSHLQLVPERFQARTDGLGVLWIEPSTGTVVDYQEHGISYFVQPTAGVHVADFHEWRARYTDATRAAQIAGARQRWLWMMLVETWLPGALLLAGVLWLPALLLWRRWRARRSPTTMTGQDTR